MNRFFAPSSIAVVGASSEPERLGGQIVRQLLRHGYAGDIYPVNPSHDYVQGLRSYKTVADLPLGIDVAVVAVRSTQAIEAVEQCGVKGIPYVIVVSSGFADAGAEGGQLQDELLAVTKRYGLRMLGPNCVGYMSMSSRVYAGFGAFYEYEFDAGSVSFVTQSGGVGGALLTIADEAGVRFQHFVHTANAADIDVEAVLDAFIDDPKTKILAAYIEGLAEGSNFGAVAARALAADKPLVVWKAGRSEDSAMSVISHTGRVAGAIDRYRALFRKHGVVEVDDTDQFVDVLRLLQASAVPSGGKIGVVSVSGGIAVVAADALASSDYLTMPDFSSETERRISQILPSFAKATNPIDITGQVITDPELLERVVTALREGKEVDAMLVCVASLHSKVGEKIAHAICATKAAVDIPVIVAWAARESLNGSAFSQLNSAGIPVFRNAERAVCAMDRVMPYVLARNMKATTKIPEKNISSPERSIKWGKNAEYESLEILAARGINIPKQSLALTRQQAILAADTIGYPVVMKIQSPDIPHKAEIGGVHLGIANAAEATLAYEALDCLRIALPEKDIRGVIVQKAVPAGVEILCGFVRDVVLGDFIVCGTGGSNVEKQRDVRLVAMPANAEELRRALLLTSVGDRLAEIAGGVEGAVDLLLKLQQVVECSGNELQELEINPVIASADAVIAVDALIVLKGGRA